MSKNFYYRPRAQAVAGSAAFKAGITANPVSLGLTASQATAYGVVDTALQAAWALASDPSTRTKGAVAGMNTALRAMRASAMNLARIIYSTSTVTDQQLVDLGLLPRPSRTPRPVPSTPPVVEVTSVMNRLVGVRIHAADTERRGLPFGAKGANVYSFVGPTAPTDPLAYHFEGMTTRSITQIQFPNTVAGGATVWLSACWVSARGETSPASAPMSFTIQGGGSLPEAA